MLALTVSLVAAAPLLVSARHVPFGTRPHVARQAQTFGTCGAPTMIFAAGLDNRKETSFEPTDKTEFNHGSAQNPVIIGQFLTLVNSCGLKRANAADAAPLKVCDDAFAALQANPAKTGATADTWNKAFGVTTNFASVTPLGNDGKPVAGAAAAAPAAGAGANGNGNAGNAGGNANAGDGANANAGNGAGADAAVDPTNDPDAADCVDDSGADADAGGDDADAGSDAGGADDAPAVGNEAVAAPAGDFGSCSDPTILFTSNLPDRAGSGFIASNLQDFNHGSALNIGVIASFICDRLNSPCNAPQATLDACNAASALAKTTGGGKDQTSADAFNSALTGDAATAPDAGAAATTTAAPAAATTAAPAAATTSAAAAATGQNVNKFTGALGAPPTPIINSGGARPFSGPSSLVCASLTIAVANSPGTFINFGAAAGRACDVQKNGCACAPPFAPLTYAGANAANSGGDFTVGECDAQRNACAAANGV